MSSKDEEEVASSYLLPEGYSFTTKEMDPHRISRLELELVNFTLNLTRRDGTQSLITDPVCVQSILNQVRDFNKSLVSIPADNISSCGDDGVDRTCIVNEMGADEEGKNKGGGGTDIVLPLHIEIKLDPLNSVNTYRIPA